MTESPIKLYRTQHGVLLQKNDQYFVKDTDWDELIQQDNLYATLNDCARQWPASEEPEQLLQSALLRPASRQEIWASGVTYKRSREARVEESKDAGGGDFYDRVYDAERPEIFFKCAAFRSVGHAEALRIRKDSTWNVPEPELTLLASRTGKITGYTIGNDMSSRSIEGENPLYLPQAKSYDGCAALGPCISVFEKGIPADAVINMTIERSGRTAFEGSVGIDNMKRTHTELVEYLFRECSFPHGCFLMTGTGIVPDHTFTLFPKDVVHISIEHIGMLTNTVA
jgi:2-dehydro-3-deoxy-D-arabinonate dehydratase